MTERNRNIVVGLTTLAGVVGLAGMLLLFGYVPPFFEDRYPVQVLLADAGGLGAGSRVRLRGIGVGVVEEIHLTQENGPAGVAATAMIDREIDIPQGAVALVRQPLLGAGSALAIDLSAVPEDQPVAPLPKDGSATIPGRAPGIGEGLGAQFETLLEEPMQRLNRLTVAFEGLSQQWQEVGANIAELTENRMPEAVDAGDATANLATVLARTDARLAELANVLEGVQQWTDNEQLRKDLAAAAANARKFSETLPDRADAMQGDIRALTRRYVAVADDLAAAVGEMEQLLETAREGEGTLGRLVQDPALYENMEDAAQRLNQTLVEMQLLIQKWKAEGLPVQF